MNTLYSRILSIAQTVNTPARVKILLVLGGLLAMVLGSGADGQWV